MIQALMTFVGIEGTVSNDVAFAISAGLVFLIFCVFLGGLGAVFGRWFK